MNTYEWESYVQDSIQRSSQLKQLEDEGKLLQFAVTGLCEESGEVAGLLCREVYKDRDMPEYRWQEELGDVLWYLIAAAQAKGYTLEDLLNYNMQKLKGRYQL